MSLGLFMELSLFGIRGNINFLIWNCLSLLLLSSFRFFSSLRRSISPTIDHRRSTSYFIDSQYGNYSTFIERIYFLNNDYYQCSFVRILLFFRKHGSHVIIVCLLLFAREKKEKISRNADLLTSIIDHLELES